MTRVEHLLACLAEECDEIGKNCMKALRFGLQDGYPGTSITNAESIRSELIDLVAVAQMLSDEGAIPGPCAADSDAVRAKIAKVEKFMLYAEEHGTLTRGPHAG